MKLNIFNNFRAVYYNTLVNFYLYFNTLVPYYDDVIISLSITSFKNIINNSSISLKSINQTRMMQLLYSLNDKDKIVIDDDGFVFIEYENTNKEVNNEIIQDDPDDPDDPDDKEDPDDPDDKEDPENTRDPADNSSTDPVACPFVYTQDIVTEVTEYNDGTVDNHVVDTQDIVIDDTPVAVPFVYTQDILIDEIKDINDGSVVDADAKKNN